MPLPHHRALLPAGDPGASPIPLSSPDSPSHTQLFIASGNTPTTGHLCLLIDRDSHSHPGSQGIHAWVAPLDSQPTQLTWQEEKPCSQDGGAYGTPLGLLPHSPEVNEHSSQTPGQGACCIPESQPNQLLASKGSWNTSGNVPKGQSLCSKRPNPSGKKVPRAPQTFPPGRTPLPDTPLPTPTQTRSTCTHTHSTCRLHSGPTFLAAEPKPASFDARRHALGGQTLGGSLLPWSSSAH